MPEILPQFDKLLFPTIKALIELGGSGSHEEIEEKIIELESYPESYQEIMNNDGQSMFSYRLRWARSYLKKVNAINNSQRGIWSLTDFGRSLTAKDCEGIPKLVRQAIQKQNKEKKSQTSDEPDKVNEIISDEDNSDWRSSLLQQLIQIDPTAFERLCQRILRESGFTKVEITGKSGDGGIDGMGLLRINLISFTILFQCKRYKDTVGSSVVRDFRGAMQGRCDKGLIITTGTFTSEAKKEATRDGAPTIDLIDGDALCELIKELKLGISTEQIEKVSIDYEWFKTI